MTDDLITWLKNEVKRLVAENSQLRAELAGRWLPIESAPLDQTVLLAFEKKFAVVAHKQNDGSWGAFVGGNVSILIDEAPTHWMPLPAPPQPESAT